MSAAEAALALEFPRTRTIRRPDARGGPRRRRAGRVRAGPSRGEGSKTIREARREPPRAATILRLAAEEGRRLAGETLPFDSREGSENRVGYYFRFPAGVVAAITPFNDPLAMVAHKAGPAIAAGNAVVLKPSSATPLSALRLAADLVAAGLPAGRLNVVTGSGEALGPALVTDPRVRVVTFTGGVATGAADRPGGRHQETVDGAGLQLSRDRPGRCQSGSRRAGGGVRRIRTGGAELSRSSARVRRRTPSTTRSAIVLSQRPPDSRPAGRSTKTPMSAR